MGSVCISKFQRILHISIIINIIFIILFWEFFKSASGYGFSLEFEWQQISSNLLDSSQYSGRSQYCSILDGLHSSANFQVFQYLYKSFGECTKSTNYNLYKHHFQVPQFLQFSGKVNLFIFLFTFFQFYSMVSRNSKVHNFASSLFLLLIIIRSGRLAESIVIDAFDTVTEGLLKGLGDLEVEGRVETIQTTALMTTAWILRRVLETWGDLLSLKLQWKTINWNWCEGLIIIIIIEIIITISLHVNFSHQWKLIVYRWSLSNSKSSQVSRNRLSILAVLNNAVIRMVSILPLISTPSIYLSKPLGTNPSASTTIGITVTHMFHCFFSCLAMSKSFSIFSFSFLFTLWSAGTTKSVRLQILIFFG